MTRRDDTIALRHMLDHAAEAVAIAHGRRRTDLDVDRLFVLAMVKLVEIVGEAANRVSSSTWEIHPEIPWRDIVGTRNRLVHGYEQVDYDVLWRIVSDELPSLVEQLTTIVSNAPRTKP